MLINVSRFVPVQRTVRDFLSVYEKKLREAVKANYAMPEKSSSQNLYMKALKSVFDEEYAGIEFSWDEVRAALFGVFEHLRLFVVNSKTDEALDFRKYEKDGIGLTAIAIGGLSLSRGLTIEGLTVSYMYRNTAMYDTLMQMGRWFGYRKGYEDLCRVHLSPGSIDWYAHIANAADELRQQIKRMRRDGMSPRQFGLYVMAHPDSLLVTARNKMRSGEKVIVNQNFSGQLIESTWLSLDPETAQSNEKIIAAAWKDGFGGKSAEPTDKGWVFKDVEIAAVEDFLTRFEVHTRFAGRRSAAVEYLQAVERQFPTADVLLISKDERPEDLADHRLGAQDRNKPPENGVWHAAKDRVASRGDEKHGLTVGQKADAVKLALDDDGKEPSDTHYRTIRNKPLLMVHALSIPEDKSEGAPRLNIPAVGVSFPPGLYTTEIKVVANRIWLTSMQDRLMIQTTRKTTMTKSLPWEQIATPAVDYNVRLAARDMIVPAFWGKDARGQWLTIVELQGDHSGEFNRDPIVVHGISVDLRAGETAGTQRLVLALLDKTDADLFFSLCEALVATLVPVSDSAVALSVTLAHLRRWKAFLSGKRTGVLSAEQVRGLFAELQFLRDLYLTRLPHRESVAAWCGADRVQQDFIFRDNAVEVKSLSGKERNAVRISSEDQLELFRVAFFLRCTG